MKIDGERFHNYLYGKIDYLCKERDRVERIEEKREIMRRINLINCVIYEFEKSIIEQDEIEDAKAIPKELKDALNKKIGYLMGETIAMLLRGIIKTDDYRDGLVDGLDQYRKLLRFIDENFDLKGDGDGRED